MTQTWQPPTVQPPTLPAKPAWYRRGWALFAYGVLAGAILVGPFTQAEPETITRTVTQTSIVERRVEVPATTEATVAPTTKPKPKPAPAPEFSDGVYKVGTDIDPGLYKATVTSGMGYWARLADPDGNNILANDVKESGTMYLRVRPTDKYIEISGATFVKVG